MASGGTYLCPICDVKKITNLYSINRIGIQIEKQKKHRINTFDQKIAHIFRFHKDMNVQGDIFKCPIVGCNYNFHKKTDCCKRKIKEEVTHIPPSMKTITLNQKKILMHFLDDHDELILDYYDINQLGNLKFKDKDWCFLDEKDTTSTLININYKHVSDSINTNHHDLTVINLNGKIYSLKDIFEKEKLFRIYNTQRAQQSTNMIKSEEFFEEYRYS